MAFKSWQKMKFWLIHFTRYLLDFASGKIQDYTCGNILREHFRAVFLRYRHLKPLMKYCKHPSYNMFQHIQTLSHICAKQNRGQCHRHVTQYMRQDQLTIKHCCWTLSFQVYLLWRCQHVISMFRARRGLGVKAASICFAISLIAAFVLAIIAECCTAASKEREGNWIFLRTRAAFPSSTQRQQQQQQRAPLLAAKHTCTTSFIKHPSM
jgi:hypothetical protein